MRISLVLILLLGMAFRFYGINWDQNQHLHPDERFLTMVTQAISFPSTVLNYFNTGSSTLNPNNVGFPFYVYGTLPIFITKLISLVFHYDTYNGITLMGRFISGMIDSSIIILVYLLGKKIFSSKTIGLFSALFYAVSVLPIQLAHFFAVDTFMVFFLLLTFYLLISKKIILSAIMFGLAIACKISAILFAPIIFMLFLSFLISTHKLKSLLLSGLLFTIFSILTVRLFQPYAFIGLINPNPKFLSNLQELSSFNDHSGWFPPAVQWLAATPILFPLENLIYWGLGPVLGIFSVISFFYTFVAWKKHPLVIYCLIWISALFVYQGFQFAMPMRYFYPLYPFLALCSGFTFSHLWRHLIHRPLMLGLIAILVFYWPLAFVSIYAFPHTRVQANQWIYNHITPGSTLSCEYWDDCLPLQGSGPFQTVELRLYDPETESKWVNIFNTLSKIDYLILSSNRLYGSMMTVPNKYPSVTQFYNDLFSGKLGFKPVAQFTSRPTLLFPGIRLCLDPPLINYGKVAQQLEVCSQNGLNFVDDYADETFTVYDHPKVIIFQKIQ